MTTTQADLPTHQIEHEDDENAHQKGYVKGTDYSLPYVSRWSRLHEDEVKNGLIRHLSCGYLSTHNTPPTLLALKQHAQSLCILIHALTPDIESTEILQADPTDPEEVKKEEEQRAKELKRENEARRQRGEPPLPRPRSRNPHDGSLLKARAFDFLSDLTTPYTNNDLNHHKPLAGLMNEVRARHEAYGTNYNCPFSEHVARGPGEQTKPYENHHLLIMHANSCLERIDHEFAATGGLLSVLPTTQPHEHDEFAAARNSLLGQWILFTQHLVARMHELEKAYANALDALAGEAAIPSQYLNSLGPDARAEREMVFPQDRWVLVNAGEDIFNNLHDIFDKQEALAQAREKVWKAQGVLGEQYWISERGGKDYARGLVPVTLKTKYYRIRGQGRGTIFMLPASEVHPGVTYTEKLEGKPTVVGMIGPKWPTKATALEQGWEEKLNDMLEAQRESAMLREEMAKRDRDIKVLRESNEILAKERDQLVLAIGERRDRRASASYPHPIA